VGRVRGGECARATTPPANDCTSFGGNGPLAGRMMKSKLAGRWLGLLPPPIFCVSVATCGAADGASVRCQAACEDTHDRLSSSAQSTARTRPASPGPNACTRLCHAVPSRGGFRFGRPRRPAGARVWPGARVSLQWKLVQVSVLAKAAVGSTGCDTNGWAAWHCSVADQPAADPLQETVPYCAARATETSPIRHPRPETRDTRGS